MNTAGSGAAGTVYAEIGEPGSVPLAAMTDDQLRMVVRAFGWGSPWDGADGTPEAEVRRRYPFLAGLHWGWRTAFDSDCAGSDVLTGYVEQSPATEAVRGQYKSTLAEWLAGSFGRPA